MSLVDCGACSKELHRAEQYETFCRGRAVEKLSALETKKRTWREIDMKISKIAINLLFAAAVLGLGPQNLVPGAPLVYAQSANDNNIKAALLNDIKKADFKNVQVSVQNGVIDLKGTVKDFATKMELEKKAQRIKNVTAVRNEVQIAGAGDVSDQQLQSKIAGAIAYDRVGYRGTSPRIQDVTPFNAIGVNVNNGVVTLSGTAYDPVSADAAVAIASRTPGVRDVINNIEVAPVSPMDDRTRIAVYRAVYGFPSLNKYAIDPAKPIRIVVVNGKVYLYGQVINQGDKDAAGIRANSVPGVFSVTNNLQVAGSAKEK
jgi:hyperosmotically inducible periplasmic protein